jgi:hypothetical protein
VTRASSAAASDMGSITPLQASCSAISSLMWWRHVFQRSGCRNSRFD